MSAPILATKLYIPPPRPSLVARPRLVERLNVGLTMGHKLTLVSAAAGFGKTTLVSEWIHQQAAGGRRQAAETFHPSSPILHPSNVAWLSLDEGDNDPTRFLTYLVAALQTIKPGIGAGIKAALQSPQPPPTDAILTTLLNEIAVTPEPFLLILDDYHLIDSQPVDQALAFLVEHQPPQMHLVITTREDPALPLARLRVRGQLTELRAADLQFTPAEAAEFFNRVMGLNLAAEEIAVLEARTEGWIAGLQLAALSMQGHQDVHGFIRAFAGEHRFIVDYLVEEVLQRQPEAVRGFLLQTAILDRLSGPLCDAVTEQTGSNARLETLQRGNFFLIPLDDKRTWYRYHHLFADVLRMYLTAEQPDQAPILHRRASAWYAQHGLAGDAIHHALAAADFDRAADLIEHALPLMRQSRQEATLLGWLQALPDEVFQRRPVLSAHYAGTLLQNGQLDGVESRLRAAERWLAMPVDRREQPVFVDEEEFQRLPGSVAMYRAAMALAQGDVANTMKYARQVLDLADEDFMRGAASALLGLAFWTGGDLETAHRMYGEGMAFLQRDGYLSDVIGGSVSLADIWITQGRLRAAMSAYEHGLQLATKPGLPPLRGAADMHVGMSEIYRERNDLATATQHLRQSKALGELNGLPKNPYRWRVAMARIQAAQGDLDGALDLLDEAERLYISDFSPNVRPVRALKTRVWLAQGRLGEALGWAREQGLSVEDDLCYLREFEHITLARIRLAHCKSDHSASPLRETIGFLARLLQAAEAGGRMGSVIEILLLQALANQIQGDIPAALPLLERALTLSEPEGYVRIFVDEGEPLRFLIFDFGFWISQQPPTEQNRKLSVYADKLLAAFGDEQANAGESWIAEQSKIQNPKSKIQNLVEPLSQRELELLRLFKTELSGPEIAQELVVALSTIRTHTKSIYSKLNVNSRRAAVNRGVELGLI
ncbi:MAG: helix-turn-helix transcriptional regulator [Caldilinea sp. CFX5]|nr:helix-turn-helix transcriptional regulator [Caldilinea sp. CFX5]